MKLGSSDNHRLGISGWINLSHSFSVITRNVVRSLVKTKHFQIAIHEPPYPVDSWKPSSSSRESLDVGMDGRLLCLPKAEELNNLPFINFAYPFDLNTQYRNQMRFLITEFGLVKPNLADEKGFERICSSETPFFTPSKWSRDRLIADGISEAKVSVIPCGYNPEIFYPFDETKRLDIRKRLGFEVDDFIILNISAMTWNKGIDILVGACYLLWKESKSIKIILKDSRFLYGITANDLVVTALKKINAEPEFLNCIQVIGDDLATEALAELYNVSDLYLSPYRAEGFNLPALEAKACGTKVLCTHGGPTMDFLDPDDHFPSTSVGSSGFPSSLYNQLINPTKHYFLEPSISDVFGAMKPILNSRKRDIEKSDYLSMKWSWDSIVNMFYLEQIHSHLHFS